MEEIYERLAPENIPWNLDNPPELLVDAVESGRIKPCRAVDLGCGFGNYAAWLARQGFEVTGMDFSEKAIEQARKSIAGEELDCRFITVDLLGDMSEWKSTFEFAFDWELLHHIFPGYRSRYIDNVHAILKHQGLYLSVHFSEKDPAFGGQGKFRKTPLGTELYFSSEAEMRRLYEPLFDIEELSTLDIKGKTGPHKVCVAWLRKRDLSNKVSDPRKSA